MTATGWILFWLALFAGTHLALSSLPVRAFLVARLGSNAFLAFYSVVAFATFVPLVAVYLDNRHSGGLLWSLAPLAEVRYAAMALAVLGIALVVAAVLQPSPALAGRSGPARVHGLTRITRHPLFMGIVLWALAHLLVNGFVTDVIFFGGLLVFSLVGAAHQDARKRMTEPERLGPFLAQTSFWPFGAVLSGRNRVVWSELPWLWLAIGAGIAIGIYALHPWLFR